MHHIDAAYCYTCRMYRGLSVCWAHQWGLQKRDKPTEMRLGEGSRLMWAQGTTLH